jgi:hypothetical protein
VVVAASCLAACAGTLFGGGRDPGRCPEITGFCAVLVANQCPASTAPCDARPLRELEALVITPLDRHGIANPSRSVRVAIAADGVAAASLDPGRYRVRSSRQPSFGFDTHVRDDRTTAIDARSSAANGARLVGQVHVVVGGGAEGNTTTSSDGPGAFLVVSAVPLVGEQRLDRTRPRFAITDQHGAFALRLPAGKYWISDVAEASEVGVPLFDSNQTPIRGQAVEVPATGTVNVSVNAVSMAP